ncbi:MAG TPA: DUF4389 domain-containing protein [Conexibacter sp.]|nr:DUF4389 domain-containing protein [Conexibacter sp.]
MSSPVKLIVTDDLQRSRLTVFFRILLALPHLVWLLLWGVVTFFAVIANWFATLVSGTPPQGLHSFISRYLRYEIHVGAYLYLIANRFPGFAGEPGYEVDVELPAPARQNRWTVFFRLLLLWPAFLLAAALTGGIGQRSVGGLLISVAFLGWFVGLFRARMPRGMRDAGAYGLSYNAQLSAYLFVLTDRYPNSDPQTALEELPAREDPIRLDVEDDLRRSRLTVFFRLLLAIPHIVWLFLWGIAVFVALVVNWFATLFAGRSPDALHRFLGAYLRYQTHVVAYIGLTANPFPGFLGEPGTYPVDLQIAPREEQNRWTVFFRMLLALPAALISAAYGGLFGVAAFLGWFVALVRGELPVGLRNAMALALRYQQQLNAYVYLLTPSYPYSGPIALAPVAADGAPPPAFPPDALVTPA